MANILSYTPQRSVCCKAITIETERNIIKAVDFTGGCNGNLQGLSILLQGMSIDEAIKRLEGIDCKGKGTSCPDQLAKALKEIGAE